MNQTMPVISFIAALFIFTASIIKIGLLIFAFHFMSLAYPLIFPNLDATPWWVYLIYGLIMFSGTMFVYSYLEEKKREKQVQKEH